MSTICPHCGGAVTKWPRTHKQQPRAMKYDDWYKSRVGEVTHSDFVERQLSCEHNWVDSSNSTHPDGWATSCWECTDCRVKISIGERMILDKLATLKT